MQDLHIIINYMYRIIYSQNVHLKVHSIELMTCQILWMTRMLDLTYINQANMSLQNYQFSNCTPKD